MLERLLIALVVVGAIALVIASARFALRVRDRRILERLAAEAADEADSGGAGTRAPRVVYFTTTSCVVCRVQQEPAIERLREELPELRIEQHDAVKDRELADKFGVLSVPTTAVYDRSGALVAINRGFAPAAQLYAQANGSDPVMEGGLAMASERLDRGES